MEHDVCSFFMGQTYKLYNGIHSYSTHALLARTQLHRHSLTANDLNVVRLCICVCVHVCVEMES